MNTVEERLARIETKLDGFLDKLKDHSTDLDKLTARVEQLEKWKAALIGGGAAIGAIVSQLWQGLSHLGH